jgi:three-Cys-motif partner protein
MTTRDCRRCGRKTATGNCPDALTDDGHVVQCVGEWADNEKHEYLRRYVEATRQVRRKFADCGFVDLFAGPGKVRLRDTNEVCDGSPLIALKHEFAPFSKVVLCDLAAENVAALAHRTAPYPGRVEILTGDANVLIEDIASHLPKAGLNLAFIDPFGLRPLNFATIRRLAEFERMDFIINFPTSDIRRNQETYFAHGNDYIARMLGDLDWREKLPPTGDFGVRVLDQFSARLASLGYDGERTRDIVVSMGRGAELYRIVFASRHRLAAKIWNDITKHTARNQRGFGFD